MSYFIKYSTPMDPLFTFNSQQFRPFTSIGTTNTHQQPTTLLKRSGKLTADQIQGANIANNHGDLQPCFPRRRSLRKEKENRRNEEAKSAAGKKLGQAAKKCGKKKKESDADQLLFSFRYSHQLTNKQDSDISRGRSTECKRRDGMDGRERAGNTIQQQSCEPHRKRRTQSVKLSPRIVIPLSDRKLPKVFKVRHQQQQQYQEYLPPIKSDQVRKYDSLELRQVRSANRTRCSAYLQFYHEKLEQLGRVMIDQAPLVPF